MPEGGLRVLDEMDVVVLVSPGDGGEGVQCTEVLQRFGAGEVAPVPVQERVLELGTIRSCRSCCESSGTRSLSSRPTGPRSRARPGVGPERHDSPGEEA